MSKPTPADAGTRFFRIFSNVVPNYPASQSLTKYTWTYLVIDLQITPVLLCTSVVNGLYKLYSSQKCVVEKVTHQTPQWRPYLCRSVTFLLASHLKSFSIRTHRLEYHCFNISSVTFLKHTWHFAKGRTFPTH